VHDLAELKAQVAAAPQAFYGRFISLRRAGNNWLACCPFHAEGEPSFTIYPDGHFHCYGCQANGDAVDFLQKHEKIDTAAAIARVQEIMGGGPAQVQKKQQRASTSSQGHPGRDPDVFYAVTDLAGNTIAEHLRWDEPTGKVMSWRRPSSNGAAPAWGLGDLKVVDLPLYPLWVLATQPERPVIVVEGEKSAEALIEKGIKALGTYGSSTVPSLASLSHLRGRRVYLWPDNDDPGRSHMHHIGQALMPLASGVKLMHWPDAPPKGDAADFLADHTADDVLKLMELARPVATREVDPSISGLEVVNVSVLLRHSASIEWLWDSWIPKGVITMLVGDPDMGKSQIALYLAACVSNGIPWPDGTPSTPDGEPGPVLINDTESQQVLMAQRIRQWGLEQDLIFTPGTPADPYRSFMLNDLKALAAIHAAVVLRGFRMVVVDSLSTAKGDKVKEVEAEMMSLLSPWAGMARDTGVALVIIHHINKARGEHEVTLDRVRGSSSIAATARSVIAVDTPLPGDERRRLHVIKLNAAAKPAALGFRLTETGPEWCEAPRRRQKETQVDVAVEFLKGILRPRPMLVGEIMRLAEAEGLTKNRVYEAKRELGLTTLVDDTDEYRRRTLWSLPATGRG
jgi:hypothetical protein